MKKEIIDNQKGSSFVESLITIVVAGMACVAFISVTASIVKETKNREVRELMTSYALNGLDKVRAINGRNQGYVGTDNENHPMSEIAFGFEYDFAIDEDEIQLLSQNGGIDCTEEAVCENLNLEDEDGFFYRMVTLEKVLASNDKVVRVTVEVGRNDPVADDNLNSYSVEGFIATL